MYLLGYDIGSSSVKAAIIDAADGKTIISDFFPKKEAPIKALKPGWAEQNPADWWNYLKSATHSILEQSGIDASDIKAIGISYQMHGLVAIDRDKNPLRDSIIWCDSRGTPYGNKAFKELGADKCFSSLLNSPGNFTISKLAWLKENEPEIYRKIYKVLLPGDYIAMRMTGEIATTVEGLSEYMLWDFKENRPAHFLLEYFDIDESLLPEIVPTFGFQGGLLAEPASELGLPPGIPITYRAGDQPNNALSLNVFEPGEVASTAGTSGVVYGINEEISFDPLSRVNNFAHVNHTAERPRIGVMTCINGTGILNSWLKRNFVPDGISYAEMNEIAAKAPAGSEGLSVLPFGNGAERILCNRHGGCSIHGLNFNFHSLPHILRASQEGIVFSFAYGMEIMRKMGLKTDNIHAASANMFLSPIFRQTLSNVADARIRLFETDGAVGAALGAALGADIYKSRDDAFLNLKETENVTPDADQTAVKEAYNIWKEHLEKEYPESENNKS